MREHDIEEYLVNRVKAMGGEVRKVRWIGRNGAPDRMVMLAGRTTYVELKSPGEHTKPHQAREHDRMRKHGGLTVEVADSYERVDEILSLYHNL